MRSKDQNRSERRRRSSEPARFQYRAAQATTVKSRPYTARPLSFPSDVQICGCLSKAVPTGVSPPATANSNKPEPGTDLPETTLPACKMMGKPQIIASRKPLVAARLSHATVRAELGAAILLLDIADHGHVKARAPAPVLPYPAIHRSPRVFRGAG